MHALNILIVFSNQVLYQILCIDVTCVRFLFTDVQLCAEQRTWEEQRDPFCRKRCHRKAAGRQDCIRN